MKYSVLLANGSLVQYSGQVPMVGSTVTAVLKDRDGLFETVTAEILAIWEEK